MLTNQKPVKSVKIIHIHDHHTEMAPIEANHTYILEVEYEDGSLRRKMTSGSGAEKKFGKSNKLKNTNLKVGFIFTNKLEMHEDYCLEGNNNNICRIS